MLVDDHQLFADGLSAILESANPLMQVTAFTDAREALRELESGLDVDLILLDLHMPQMDGIDFLLATKQLVYVPAVLIVSSDIDVRVIYRGLSQGAAGFVPKSVDSKSMLAAIEMTLENGVYIPEELQMPLNAFKQEYEALMAVLTERQLQILIFLNEGLTNAQMAERLFLSRHAVKYHLSHLFEALRVNSRADCIEKAKAAGLLGIGLTV